MSHVDDDITNCEEGYGRSLGKLEKSAYTEAECKEDSEELSAVHLVEFLPVDPVHHYSHDQV